MIALWLLAQTATVPAAPSAAPVMAPTTVSLVLPAGTPIRFVTNAAIDSRSVRQGQRFALTVADDVKIGDFVAIPKGTPAVGEILSLSEKGMFGKNAKFSLQPLFIDWAGKRINLTGRFDQAGQKQVTAAAITTFGITGFGIFITGKSATLPAGSELTGAVRTDTTLSHPSSH